MIKLNLGCGPDYKPGYVNVDYFALHPVDMRVDLTAFNWPWADGSVDQVHMNHVLEHLIDTERTVREIHRILKSGSVFWGQVPFCWSDNGVTEYGHVHLFHWYSFYSMEKIGFKCNASPAVLSNGDPNQNWRRRIRNLVPLKKVLTSIGVRNMYDVINFELTKCS